MTPDIRSLVEQSLKVRTVADTVALFGRTLSPPISYDAVDVVRRRMAETGKAPYQSRGAKSLELDEGEGRSIVTADRERLLDARLGCERLADRTNALFAREAARRRISHAEAVITLHRGPEHAAAWMARAS